MKYRVSYTVVYEIEVEAEHEDAAMDAALELPIGEWPESETVAFGVEELDDEEA
jgi:hypothetical protein